MTHRPGSPSGTIRRPARSTMASSRIATVSVTVASFQRCGAGAFSGRNVRTESPALHDGRDPGRGEQAGCLELHPPFAVAVRPWAGGFSRREFEEIPIVVEALDQTVDPSEAQRLADGFLVRDRLHAGVGLIEREPNPGVRRLVPFQPRAPFLAGPNVQARELLSHLVR